MKSRTLDKTRLAQKRGQGRVGNYRPWIRIHEISSKGISWRILGKKTGRIHHLLSTLEKKVFLYLDAHPLVSDIREQFPLPLKETLAIASTHNIRHGQVENEPITMTTDFLIDLPNRQIAIFVKPFSKISKRVLEKFQIEKSYWKSQNVEMILCTEKEINELNLN